VDGGRRQLLVRELRGLPPVAAALLGRARRRRTAGTTGAVGVLRAFPLLALRRAARAGEPPLRARRRRVPALVVRARTTRSDAPPGCCRRSSRVRRYASRPTSRRSPPRPVRGSRGSSARLLRRRPLSGRAPPGVFRASAEGTARREWAAPLGAACLTGGIMKRLLVSPRLPSSRCFRARSAAGSATPTARPGGDAGEAVTPGGMKSHEQALQAIATANGGTGRPGRGSTRRRLRRLRSGRRATTAGPDVRLPVLRARAVGVRTDGAESQPYAPGADFETCSTRERRRHREPR
jgi:hypothetical protein